MATNGAKPINPDFVKWFIGAMAAFALLPVVGIFVGMFCLLKAFKALIKASNVKSTGEAPTLESLLSSVRSAASETVETMQDAVDAHPESNPRQGARRAHTSKPRNVTPAPKNKAIPKLDTPLVEEGFKLFGRRPKL